MTNGFVPGAEGPSFRNTHTQRSSLHSVHSVVLQKKHKGRNLTFVLVPEEQKGQVQNNHKRSHHMMSSSCSFLSSSHGSFLPCSFHSTIISLHISKKIIFCTLKDSKKNVFDSFPQLLNLVRENREKNESLAATATRTCSAERRRRAAQTRVTHPVHVFRTANLFYDHIPLPHKLLADSIQ